MEETNELKSQMEIALEFIADNPLSADALKGDQFQVFWDHTELVLAQYKASIEYLKTSFQFTDEMIKENCIDYLSDACVSVLSDLNNN